MIEELKEVFIEEFPELSSLLSSDKIIVFRKDGDDYMPSIHDIIELSTTFLLESDSSKLDNALSSLSTTFNNVISYLSDYLVDNNTLNNYSTIDNMNETLNEIETVDGFKAKVANKADKTYLNAQYNLLISKLRYMKSRLATDTSYLDVKETRSYMPVIGGQAAKAGKGTLYG